MVLHETSSQKRYHRCLILAPPLSLLLMLDQHLVIALLEASELVLLHPESYRERNPNHYVKEKETADVVRNRVILGLKKHGERVC